MDVSKFNRMMDLEGLKADIEDTKQNGGPSFAEVTPGEYEVRVKNIELKESKAGDPMVSIQFKILEGEFKNSSVWMNQVITKGFQIHIVNEFLRAMLPDADIEFVDYVQYNNLLLDCYEEIDKNFEYNIKYGKKGNFPTFEVLEIFERE